MADTKDLNAKDKLILQLQNEKDNLDPGFEHAKRLVSEELERVQSGRYKIPDMIEIHMDKPMKLVQRVIIPVKEHPKYNFVGKLLGPKGNTMKRLQEETATKMAVLGRGSMKDKKQEEEFRQQGGKYAHLNEELHVAVEVFMPPCQGFRHIGAALSELQKYLIPVDDAEDDIRQQQMHEMMLLNGADGDQGAPPVQRGAPGMMPPRGSMGPSRGSRGAPRGAPRGGPMGGLLATPGGRMAPPRGALSQTPSRGVPRGSMRGSAQAARPLASRAAASASSSLDAYSDESYPAYSSNSGYAREQQDYGYEQDYTADTYEQGYSTSSSAAESQFVDYGHGPSSEQSYDGYSESWPSQTASYTKAPVSRPATRGTGARLTTSRGVSRGAPTRGAASRGAGMSVRSHPYPTGRGARY